VKFNEAFLGQPFEIGPWTQVSRLGNPLFNEVIVPMASKDFWNSSQPAYDSQFAKYVSNPELANLLPALYTPPSAASPAAGAFPKLFSYNNGSPNRVDLLAILLTGIPAGTLSVAPTFQNFTGPTQADMLRLNMAIGPSAAPNTLGLLALDAAGFPNGRRVFDDVVTIELRAIAGVLAPGIVPGFPNPGDGAAGAIYDLVGPPQRVQRPERRELAAMSSHEHTHHTGEHAPGPSEGAVFIDVGEGVGAAVIYTEHDLDGAELEIRPAAEQWRGLHTAVRERRQAGAVQFAAVFGSLAEGDWELRVRGSTNQQPALAVQVIGGSVVEATWPVAS
jgi:hypothetical protein